jgi:hypothetical protein
LLVVLVALSAGCGDDGSPAARAISNDDARPHIVDALAGPLWGDAGTVRFRIANGPWTELTGDLDDTDGTLRAKITAPDDDGDVHDLYFEADRYWEFDHAYPESGWNEREYGPGDFPLVLPNVPLLTGNEPGDGPTYASEGEARRTVVDALIASLEEIGDEEVRGVATRGFRVRLSGEAAVASLPEALADEVMLWSDDELEGEFDVWLDGDGQVRRVETTYSIFDQPARVVIELWDQGEPLTVERPTDVPPARFNRSSKGRLTPRASAAAYPGSRP